MLFCNPETQPCLFVLTVFFDFCCWLFLLLVFVAVLAHNTMLVAQLQLVRHKNCIESVPVACIMGCQKPWFDIGFLHVSGSDLLWVIMGGHSQHGWLWSPFPGIKPLVYADIPWYTSAIFHLLLLIPLLNTPQRNLDFGFDFFIHRTHMECI